MESWPVELERNTSLYPLYGYAHSEVGPWEAVEAELGNGLCAHVFNFGGQKSQFTIYLRREGIEQAITALAEAGDPWAIEIQKARKLADAVKDCLTFEVQKN